MLEVGDRRAFAQEFGIGRDRHAVRRALLLRQDLGDPVAGADRHGRLGDDHDRPGRAARPARATAANTKLRSAWPSPRRAGVPTAMNTASAPSTASAEIGGEAQPPALDIGLDQRLQPRLPDRHPPGEQARRSWPGPCRRRSHDGRSRRSRRPTRGRHSRFRSSRCACVDPSSGLGDYGAHLASGGR